MGKFEHTIFNPICRYAIKLMKKNETGGRIVNMSSVNAATAIGRFSGTGIGSCIVSLLLKFILNELII